MGHPTAPNREEEPVPRTKKYGFLFSGSVLSVVRATHPNPGRPKKKKGAKSAREDQIILDPAQDKALRLVDKSAKIRAELEGAVSLAAAKAVRKVMKDQGISLTPTQTTVLTSIWFGDVPG